MKRSAVLAVTLACGIAAGIAVRAISIGHELELDEVWSLEIAGRVASPLDVFLSIHHDNNHYLNTLYLAAVGPNRAFGVYHLPSLASGVLLLVLLSVWTYRRDRLEGCIVALLVGDSLLFARYSVEARGFMPMLLFAFLSTLALKRYLETRRRSAAVLFWTTAILAFLWQLTYVEWYAVLVIWSIIGLRKTREGSWIEAAGLLHLPVGLFLAVLSTVDIRRMILGGIPSPQTLGETVVAGLSIVLGAQSGWRLESWTGLVVGGAALLVLVWSIRDAAIRALPRGPLGVAFGAIALALAVWVATRTTLVTARLLMAYLLVVLLFIAYRLRLAIDAGGTKRIAAIMILAAICVANAIQLRSLVRYGSGRYQDPIDYAVAHDPGTRVTISGNREWRTNLLLRYYATRVRTTKIIDRIDEEPGATGPATWLLVERAKAVVSPLDVDHERYARVDLGERGPEFWALYRATGRRPAR